MDLVKIPLWLFLVTSTLSMSSGHHHQAECLSKCNSNCLSKYLVPNNADVTNKNCFCFKKPGDHRSVTDILNKNNNELGRLVVYLYKDKSTDQVKLYIPNGEKQSLVPDLAFEVGDILKSLEDDSKVKDILNLYVRTKTPQTYTEHPDINEVIPTETTVPDTIQNVISHEVTHSPKSNEKYNDDVNSHDSSVINLQPTEVINKPAKGIVVDFDYPEKHYWPENYVDINKTPSKEVDVPNEGVNINEEVNPTTESINDNGSYGHEQYLLPENNVDFNKTPSKEVDIPDEGIHFDDNNDNEPKGIHFKPFEVENISAEDSFDHNEKHHLPKNNFVNKMPSKEVGIPGEGVNIDDDNYNEPNGINLIPTEEVNVPPKSFDNYGFDDHEKHLLPDGIHLLPSEVVNIPAKSIGVTIDNDKYNEPNYINLIPPELVNIPAENINVSGFDDHEQHYLPVNNLDINKTPLTEENISDDDIITDNVNHHDTKVINEMPFKIVNIPDKGTINYANIKGRPHYHINKVPKQSETHSNENKWNAYIQSNEEARFIDKTHASTEKQGSKDKQAISSFENHNEYETFDRWFVQQMQRFKTYTEHDRAIDLTIIERYILKILKDNDMHVTNEGVLTDSFGTALDLQNLHLRPILIGNSLAFGSILNENIRDLVMPANLAYLQAILVTNSNPSMILGIIPIGKTVIPPSTINAFSTLLKPRYNTLLPAKHYRTYITTKVKPIKYNKTSAQVNNMEFIYEKKPIVLHLTGKLPVVGPKKSKTFITIVKQTPVKKLHYHQTHASVNTPQVYDGRYSERKEIALSNESLETVNKLIESLRDGHDPIKSADATNKLLASLRNDKDFLTSKLTYGNSNPVDVDDEDISERIIGGNAATSSGAPLSVKGRIKD